MSEPALRGVGEAAQYLGVSRYWLYRNAGVTIPVTQFTPGGRLFWTQEQLDQIIASGAIQPGTKKPAPSAPSRGRRRPAIKPAPASAGVAQVAPLRARPEARRKGRGGKPRDQ